MGFLHKLWDDTVAGPTPDSGLGKLRKYNSLSAAAARSSAAAGDDTPVSRSITILRTDNLSTSPSTPSSPAASETPTSPFSPTTPGGNFKKLTRRKSDATHRREPKSPTGYDWIVLTSLDR